jgi:ABC-2 type transport system permease protein
VIFASFRAEWFKTVRRPAVWVVVGILIVLAVGLSYFVVYLVATHAPVAPRRGLTAAALSALRASVYPASYVRKTVGQMENVGGIFALILGVLVHGSEFGWQTVKTAYIQWPGRLAVLAGRLSTLGLMVLIMVLALFAFDAAASYGLALLDGKSTAFPSVDEIGKGVGAAWLILAFWAGFGFALANLLRQSAMAIGLGLGYGLVIETLVFDLLNGLGDVVKQVHVWFPIANASYLIQSFGTVAGGGGAIGGAPAAAPDADATHAALVLGGYLVGMILLSAALIKRRDVT